MQRHKASGKDPASKTNPPASAESKMQCCDNPEEEKSKRFPRAEIDPLARKTCQLRYRDVKKTWIRHAEEKTSNRLLREEEGEF